MSSFPRKGGGKIYLSPEGPTALLEGHIKIVRCSLSVFNGKAQENVSDGHANIHDVHCIAS